jgi:hypothetical protein
MVEGKCHCGQVTTQVTAQKEFQFLCHCKTCQKLCGGGRLGGIMFSSKGFSVTGDTTKYIYQGGKKEIESHFCSSCGAPMYAYPKAEEGKIVLKANSLVDSASFNPEKSIFVEEACPWEKGFVG